MNDSLPSGVEVKNELSFTSTALSAFMAWGKEIYLECMLMAFPIITQNRVCINECWQLPENKDLYEFKVSANMWN